MRYKTGHPKILTHDVRDNIQTMVVTDADGYLIRVGDPSVPTNKELASYAKKGYKIETILFKEYRMRNLKWCWEKKQTN